MHTILIVEDHALSRNVLTTLLGYYGHHLLEATDGLAALGLARGQRPDLIITDIVMPNMDGIEFVRQLRGDKGMEEIPVIFYTATYRLPDARRLVEGFRNCHVIPKPSEPSVILQIVNDLLGISWAEVVAPSPIDHLSGVSRWSAELQLAALVDLSFHLVSQREPSRLLENSCKALRGIVKCRYVQLAVVEEDGHCRYYQDACGAVLGDAPAEASLPPAEILDRVVAQRGILRRAVTDAEDGAEKRRVPSLEAPLVIPFATQSQVYGWIGLGDKLDGAAYTADEEDMAVALCTQTALAYENLLLSKNLRQNVVELNHSEERLRLAVESAKLGTWEWEPATGNVIWSDRCRVLFGLAPDASVDYLTFLDRLHPDDRGRVHLAAQKAIEPGGPGEFCEEYRCLCPDGTQRFVSGMGKAVYDVVDGHRRAIRLIGTVQDVTERARAEMELRQAKDAAEQAARAKRQFLANMSHELRTPMTGVLGMLDLALAGNLGAEEREFVSAAHTSATSLVRILNDILDLTRMEIGKFSIEEKPFSIRQCLKNTVNILLPVANSKGLSLEYRVADDVPESVIGDQTRLNQVLTNLAGNAVKFTAHGKVAVSIAAAGSTPDGSREISFTVTDTGIGIPREKEHLLFQYFSQVDGSHSRSYGGTGLGLAITKQIVERMNGTIGFTSKEGQGSTFSCTIPFTVEGAETPAPGKAVPAKPASAPVAEGGHPRLLIAEDDAVIRQVLGAMFQRVKYEVVFAENGEEAIKKWETGAFDLILMDVQMPVTDGFEAAGAIRAIERTRGGHIPIIAMTAHALKEDQDRCLHAGMDAYIAKPVDFKACLRIIGEALQQTGG